MQTLGYTNFHFNKQTAKKTGKVRDTYIINNDLLVAITTDRISAFDSIIDSLVPFKGQVLNGISAYFLESTKNIIPNWLISTPHDHVSIGLYCNPYPIEIVVRKRLSGSSWRNYKNGNRKLGDIILEDNLYENALLPKAVITPSTKNDNGHDVDISRDEIIKSNIISKEEYEQIQDHALKLFAIGEKIANNNGLVLADTKSEFGNRDNKIYLIDEVHTPDSSRYFYADTIDNPTKENNIYKLSKEYLRKWLIDNDLQDDPKALTALKLEPELLTEISNNYTDLYETITNKTINKILTNGYCISTEIKLKVDNFLSKL
ncbi:MAG: phosphoribosylaminoimidazolesuccinocarboxamide synthase [Solitalea-like symbiont of Acarus siro]